MPTPPLHNELPPFCGTVAAMLASSWPSLPSTTRRWQAWQASRCRPWVLPPYHLLHAACTASQHILCATATAAPVVRVRVRARNTTSKQEVTLSRSSARKKERKPGGERRESRCCVSSAVRLVACSPRRPSCIITTVVIVAQDCQVLPPTRKVPTAAAAALRCPILMHPDSRGRARVRAAAAEHSIQFE